MLATDLKVFEEYLPVKQRLQSDERTFLTINAFGGLANPLIRGFLLTVPQLATAGPRFVPVVGARAVEQTLQKHEWFQVYPAFEERHQVRLVRYPETEELSIPLNSVGSVQEVEPLANGYHNYEVRFGDRTMYCNDIMLMPEGW